MGVYSLSVYFVHPLNICDGLITLSSSGVLNFNYRLLFFPWIDQYTKLAGQALAIHIKFKISLAIK